MRNAKASITRLESSIKKLLPDGNDIFSYPGVSKVILVNALDSSYQLLSALDKYDDSYELMFLKRSIERHVKKASKFLSKDDIESNFNYFLNELGQLRYRIRESYLILTENTFRDEHEIIAIKKRLKELNSLTAAYSDKKQSIDEILSSITASNSRITKIDNDVSGGSEKINKLFSTITENQDKISQIQANCTTWNKEVESSTQQMNTHKAEYEAQSQKINSLASRAEQYTQSVKKIEEELLSQKKKADDQLVEIREIVDDANRVGMAGSFKARKDELDKPVKWAEAFMNISLFVVTAVSFYIIIPEIGSSDVDYKSILIKLPILFPLYWIVWSSSRKFSYLTRIREDYAYKYATAMAFEGYNKHTDEDSDLYTKLLSLSIDTFGSNPIRLYNLKNVHSSPLQETLTTVKDLIKQVNPFGSNKTDDVESEEKKV